MELRLQMREEERERKKERVCVGENDYVFVIIQNAHLHKQTSQAAMKLLPLRGK